MFQLASFIFGLILVGQLNAIGQHVDNFEDSGPVLVANSESSYGTKSGHNSNRVVSGPTYSRLNVAHQTYKNVDRPTYESEVSYKPKKQFLQTSYQTTVNHVPLVHHQQEQVRTEYRPRHQVQTVYRPKVETVYQTNVNSAPLENEGYQTEYQSAVEAPKQVKIVEVIERRPAYVAPRHQTIQKVYRPRVETVYQTNVNSAPLENEEYQTEYQPAVEAPKQVKMVEVVERRPVYVAPRPQVVYRPKVETVYQTNVNSAPLENEEYQTEYRPAVEAPKQVKMVEVIERRPTYVAPRPQVVYTQRVATRPQLISSSVSLSDDNGDNGSYGLTHSSVSRSQDSETDFGHGSSVTSGSSKGGYHYNIGSSTGHGRTVVQVSHGVPSHGTTSSRSGTKY